MVFLTLCCLQLRQARNRYPNFSPDWFTKAIHFLDAAQSTAPAASRPTTAAAPGEAATTSQPTPPASEQADRLLKLAKLYMQVGKKDAARAKLNELLSRFPNEPASATARKLLVEIDAQQTP